MGAEGTYKTKTVHFETTEREQIVNLTRYAECFLRETNAKAGLLHAFTPHTTGTLFINEDEDGLKRDLLRFTACLTDHLDKETFLHNLVDHNANAHLVQILAGNTLLVPFKSGTLLLGKWQDLLFMELDGPRDRKLILSQIRF